MPHTLVVFYKEEDGNVPVLSLLDEIHRKNRRAYAKCRARIADLECRGYEMRRPSSDYLRDGIYELRVRSGNVNYRILYFFHGREAAVLAVGTTKESRVHEDDTDLAIHRKADYQREPGRCRYEDRD
jgi:hypothetical protein